MCLQIHVDTFLIFIAWFSPLNPCKKSAKNIEIETKKGTKQMLFSARKPKYNLKNQENFLVPCKALNSINRKVIYTLRWFSPLNPRKKSVKKMEIETKKGTKHKLFSARKPEYNLKNQKNFLVPCKALNSIKRKAIHTR